MDIQQIIKDRYKELPANIQQAITNTDLAPKFELIANKHGLHIDQNGALQTETILVMLGLETTDDYIDNVKKALEISRNQAIEIAKDVNTEILDSIRDSLRKIQTQDEQEANAQGTITPVATASSAPTPAQLNQMISSVEKAGDFKIENTEPQSSSPQYKEENINRDELLKGIEDPPTVVAQSVSSDAPIPLVDHLLTTPVSSPQVTEVRKVETAKLEEKKVYGTDPYRESI